MWTPALKTVEETEAEQNGTELKATTSMYLGVIFAVFMVCVMIGSSIFKLYAVGREKLYRTPLYLHAIACVSMGIITLYLETKPLVYFMFLVFESTVGVFYPSYGMIKSERIPEDIRSAVMSIFRMPLNAFVVILLLKIKYLSSQIVFTTCTVTHAVAFFSYLYFYSSGSSVDKQVDSDDESQKPMLKNDA